MPVASVAFISAALTKEGLATWGAGGVSTLAAAEVETDTVRESFQPLQAPPAQARTR